MARVVILSGSNRGDKALALARAAEALEKRVGPIVRRSAVYESEPWGFSDPENFLNQVLVIETLLEPIPLLDEIQAIEKALGRMRKRGRGVLGTVAPRGLCSPAHIDPENGRVSDPENKCISDLERGRGDVGTYESRPIDIDILFYDDLCLSTERLTVPHPLIAEREFVLVPLREVLGDFIHPVCGKPIREL